MLAEPAQQDTPQSLSGAGLATPRFCWSGRWPSMRASGDDRLASVSCWSGGQGAPRTHIRERSVDPRLLIQASDPGTAIQGPEPWFFHPWSPMWSLWLPGSPRPASGRSRGRKCIHRHPSSRPRSGMRSPGVQPSAVLNCEKVGAVSRGYTQIWAMRGSGACADPQWALPVDDRPGNATAGRAGAADRASGHARKPGLAKTEKSSYHWSRWSRRLPPWTPAPAFADSVSTVPDPSAGPAGWTTAPAARLVGTSIPVRFRLRPISTAPDFDGRRSRSRTIQNGTSEQLGLVRRCGPGIFGRCWVSE